MRKLLALMVDNMHCVLTSAATHIEEFSTILVKAFFDLLLF